MRPALGALCVAALLVTALAGCGGEKRAPLAWSGTPVAQRLPDLPRDRVVLARVHNTSSKSVHLEARRVVVRDASGRTLRSSAQFIASFAHGLFGAFQKPTPLPPDELRRLGLVIELAPGRTAPLTVAWRLAPGSREPASVDYGVGSLRLPPASP